MIKMKIVLENNKTIIEYRLFNTTRDHFYKSNFILCDRILLSSYIEWFHSIWNILMYNASCYISNQSNFSNRYFFFFFICLSIRILQPFITLLRNDIKKELLFFRRTISQRRVKSSLRRTKKENTYVRIKQIFFFLHRILLRLFIH